MPSKSRQQRRQEKFNPAPSAATAAAETPPPFFDRNLALLIVALKVLLVLFGVVVLAVLQGKVAEFPGGWLAPWNQWDGPHYIDIARDGYVAQDVSSRDQQYWIVFYPLYPWLIRLFAVIFRNYVLSAQMVSLVGAVATALVFQRLAALDLNPKLARSAVFFMFIFPTAYFFHVVYTESVFMPLALGCVLAARQRRWNVAGALGALATMTRVNGLLLLPVMAVEAYMQYREEGRLRREWLWIGFAAVGFAVYLLINYNVFGDPLHFQKVLHDKWSKKLTYPWVGIASTIRAMGASDPVYAHLVGVQEFLFIIIGLVGVIWCWRRLRPSYAVWMTLNWLLVTSTAFIQSTPRYVLSFFPLFILLARFADERPWWGAVITIWSLVSFALFAGQFAQGYWAF